jgi:hypothetical protein
LCKDNLEDGKRLTKFRTILAKARFFRRAQTAGLLGSALAQLTREDEWMCDRDTAVVAGAGGTTGLGFVQFYSLAAPIRELNPAPSIRR